jgi:periplasmic protein TonB
MSRIVLISVSIGAHVGLMLWLGEIRVEKASAATPIEIAEVAAPAPPPPPPEPAKVEPEPPEPAREPERRKAPPAKVQAAAPPPEAAPSAPSFDDAPDFGLALDGAVGGGGLAVPTRAPTTEAPKPRVVKQLGPAPARRTEDACSDPASKPRPVNVPQPVYTDAARAAGVEGRVRVELTVDESGRVVQVKVLQGLGHGLDEAALAAARSATFTPAQRCGRAVSATFTIAMRFSAS